MAGTVQIGGAHHSVLGDSDEYAFVRMPLQPFLVQSAYSDDLSQLDIKLDITVPNPDKVYWYYGGLHESIEGEYDANNSF